jgi:predicted nucleotidyltransferase
MQTQTDVLQRYQAALDKVVARLEEDYYVLAVVLYGSLARGEPWERSDIDLVIVLRDGQERHSRDLLWVVEDDINIQAWVVTRNQFKRALESALQGSITHSVRSQYRLLFCRDESIEAWVQEPARIGAHDQELQLLKVVAEVIYPLDKATKWLVAKRDLHYCFMWTLFAVNALSKLEVVLNGEAPGREALDQALKFNPDFFQAAYRDFIDSPKREASLTDALERIDNYLLERADRLFRPILAYLAEAQGPVTAAELSNYFNKKLQGEQLSNVYEWMTRKGMLHKLSSPLRLTRKSTVTLEEPAYYYDTDDSSDWE